jgi:hypothetical protein
VGEAGRILVITSCTGLKTIGAGDAPVPAERLYRGEQHRRLMLGVEAFRAAATGYDLDLRILSAGHGLVEGAQALGFYDATFSGLSRGEIGRRSQALDLPISIRRLLAERYSLAVLLLGGDYMQAAAIHADTRFGGPAMAFSGPTVARRLGHPSLKVVPVGKEEARRFSCGLVGLKGELGRRLLHLLASRPELVPEVTARRFDVLGALDAQRQPLELAA